MKSFEYLDSVKRKLDLPSDYALAKTLGITRESVSQLRSGRSSLGLETSLKISEILDIDEHVIYSHAQIEKAKTPELRHFWESISERFSESFKLLILGSSPRQTLI